MCTSGHRSQVCINKCAQSRTYVPYAQVCTLVHRCACLCTPVHKCAKPCTSANKCAHSCTSVHACEQSCKSVNKCAHVCAIVRKCAPVSVHTCAEVCPSVHTCAHSCTSVRLVPACVHSCAQVCILVHTRAEVCTLLHNLLEVGRDAHFTFLWEDRVWLFEPGRRWAPFGCPLRSGIPGDVGDAFAARESQGGVPLGTLEAATNPPKPFAWGALSGQCRGQGVWVRGSGVRRKQAQGSLAFFLRRGRYCHFPRDNAARGSPRRPSRAAAT